MKLALDAQASLGHGSWEEVARAVAAAGFDVVELPASCQGALTPQAERQDCLELAKTFRDAGVSIAVLRADLGDTCRFSSPSAQTRQEAERLAGQLLRRAEWLGAGLVCVSPRGPGYRSHRDSALGHADALTHTYLCLSRLVGEAEVCGARLAVETPAAGFLSNPVEAAELIDRVNSPWVGICLDLDRCTNGTLLPEWIEYLSWRLAGLRATDSGDVEEMIARADLLACLAAIAFEGPIIVSRGTRGEWLRRLGVDGADTET